MTSVILFKIGKRSEFHRSFFQIVGTLVVIIDHECVRVKVSFSIHPSCSHGDLKAW